MSIIKVSIFKFAENIQISVAKERILEGAHSLFIQYGVRSVSMDDVARELAMSKKTLYLHFSNKDELVTEVVRFHMDGEMAEFGRVIESASNAVDEIFKLAKCMREHAFRVNPSLLYDLHKYHADAWAIFQEFKSEYLVGQIIDNIERGKREGYYRLELNARVLAILRMEIVQMVFSDQVFPRSEFDFIEVQMQVFDHFVHGLLSEKGKQLYQEYQSQEVNNHSK
ncbi:TetR/AcrR family transcriptional regulator [Marinoscillum luteum]|uniref:TetR/AcrR family transcriptional regulator n=1 Tax=Marinoscillum luteum TaxID=861051 RepID=A0ABW7N2S1_9BACT